MHHCPVHSRPVYCTMSRITLLLSLVSALVAVTRASSSQGLCDNKHLARSYPRHLPAQLSRGPSPRNDDPTVHSL